MAVNIAINGFGRIGRLVFRQAALRQDINILAINDIVPADNLAYLLKYDSTHGKFSAKIKAEEDSIFVDGKKTLVLSEKDPANLPWQKLNIDYVIESTGLFVSPELANKHILAGAKKVVISAPAKGDVTTLVMGVNEKIYDPIRDKIVSNASCTTNCLAPITKVLLDNFGIREGLMTTVHSVTSSQPVVDGPRKRIGGGEGSFPKYYPCVNRSGQGGGFVFARGER